MSQKIRQYLTDGNRLNGERNIRGEECAEILNELKRITGKTYKTLGPALKEWGYELTTRGKKPESPSTITLISVGEF